jgi:hypothetical protein
MKPRPTAAARALLLAGVLLLVELYFGAVVINTNLDAVYGTISFATATTIFGVLIVAGDRMYLHEKRP